MIATPTKKSDLGVRTLSAIVMVAVAGTALWLGGWVWTAFVALVALGVLWEWWGLVRGFAEGIFRQTFWMLSGLIYVGLAVFMLRLLRGDPVEGWIVLACVILGVIGTDVGAYFIGRTFGGPKIAAKISPSKTWSGLVGGIFGAMLGLILGASMTSGSVLLPDYSEALRLGLSISLKSISDHLFSFVLTSTLLAVTAQVGDFFESWMKRRAGVKDSGALIPGHGGLFDRLDGLLAVLFVCGVMMLTIRI